jgi:DNA-binding transcriptional LysR family regulator
LALVKRSIAAFDELKQSVKDIEFLADPTTGEINFACTPGIAFTFIPHVMDRFVRKYPRVVLRFDEVAAGAVTRNYLELRNRKYDLILTRGNAEPAKETLADEVSVETLFNDPLVIVAGARNKWVNRRRMIDLAELANQNWIMQPPHTWAYRQLAEAFDARGLAMPRAGIETLSVPVTTHFLTDGQFITSMAKSTAYFNSLKILPVDFPSRPLPFNIVTLSNRTLSPVVARFIGCARDVAKSISGKTRGASVRGQKLNVS